MIKITKWKKYNRDTKLFEYNHFDYGWSEKDKPLPKSKTSVLQKAWKNEAWKKIHCYEKP